VGAADPLGAGEAGADAVTAGVGDELAAGVGDELAAGDADGDVTTGEVAAGVAPTEGGADVAAVAAAVGGAGILGAAEDEVTCPDTECAPGVWCAEAARAMPPAARRPSRRS
jgi:hypothetical protein